MVTRQQMKQEHEALAPYVEAIRRYPPLGREEERALAARVRKGDASAREKLVRHNLALVLAVVRKLSRGTVRLEDLVQEGNLGLLRAVEKFDPKAGVRFATYAAWWIRAYTWKYVKEARSAVRPKSGTVAQPDLSLDAPLGDEDEDTSFLERLEDEGPGPEASAAASEDDRRVRESLGAVRRRLGELGWDIVHNRLERDHPETLEEIGNRWGISRERVRQVEVATRQFLRRYLEPLVEEESLPEAA